MDKIGIGQRLSRMRNGRSIDGLTEYTVKSIETGSSAYPVANLLLYCQSLDIQLVIIDILLDEVYPVDNLDDIHTVVQMLMKRYHINTYGIFKKTGVHYTPPRTERKSFSIDTLSAMFGVLHCKLDFIQK